ncbi:MAG: RNA chaperone Hfq [Acidobacteriota bacterium]|nr:RNA chaperone Hfq [Acidobacteriota bacterium]
MQKSNAQQGNRSVSLSPAQGRVQPFARPSHLESTLTSHGNPDAMRTGTAGQRRLIRPDLNELKDSYAPKRLTRKQSPPEQTYAESFYYLKQMNTRTPMVVVLKDGEQLRGVIEWYDRACLKVNRSGAPNLLILKHAIKYLYKEKEEGNGRSPLSRSIRHD